MSESTENVKVFVRVRPTSNFGSQKIVRVVSDREISLQSNVAVDLKYKFNGIFDEHIHPDDVNNVILVPMVREFIQGYNCTLFSYGAIRTDPLLNATQPNNGSLLSSTQNGGGLANATNSKYPSNSNDDTIMAFVSYAMYQLFEHLKQLELSSCVRITCLEIHNEELIDLMQPNNATVTGIPLKIFENDRNQVYVNGLSETVVHSANEAIMIFRMANKNLHSLKSHTIFTVSLQTKEIPKLSMQENEGLFKFRKMCLVQLGSQESQKKQARAKTVQSLTSLSRVVQALTSKQSHIPYRDSKLTRIMQDSLGGNTKTAIVASISAANGCQEETAQALEFLNRIKGISNHPKINERLDDSRTLNEMALEIRKLIMDIEANRNKTGHFLTDEMYVNYQQEMQTTRNDALRHKRELVRINEERIDLDCTFTNVNSTLCVKNTELTQLQSETVKKQQHIQIVSNVMRQRDAKTEALAVNEKIITNQAMEIKNTVRQVLSDKSKLDDCVARYKSVDDHLIQTAECFHIDMHAKLANLKQNSSIVKALIDLKLQKTGDLEKDFLRSATSLIEIIRQKSCLLLDQLEVNRTIEANKWNDIKIDIYEVLQTQLKSIDLNIRLYEEYGRKFQQQSNTIEAAYQEIREMYQHHFIAEDKMIADLKQCMQMHSINISGQIKALRGTIEECANIGIAIDEKMQSIYREMCEIVDQIQRNTLEVKTTVGPALEAAEQNMQQTRKSIIESLNAHKTAVAQHKDRFVQAKLPNDYKAKQFELKHIAQQTMALACGTIERAAINGTSSLECGLSRFEIISAEIPSKRDIIATNGQVQTLNDNLNVNQQRVTAQNKENVRIINDIVERTNEFCAINAGETASCAKQLKHFRKSDYREYQPSGETPVKRDYSTNVTLVATTPLEKIKQRFRNRLTQINATNNSPDANYSFLND